MGGCARYRNYKRRAELIKEHIDWRDVFGTGHLRCFNPEHKDEHPSAFVYPDGIFCFGCHHTLTDIFEAVRFYFGWGYTEALRRLWPIAVKEARLNVKQKRTRPIPDSVWQEWADALDAAGAAELCRRYGLNTAVIKERKLGYTGVAFSIPHFGMDGKCWGVKFRADPRKEVKGPKYWALKPSLFECLYPAAHYLQYRQSPPPDLWLVEGEFDAMALHSRGYPALALPSGVATPLEKWEDFWQQLEQAGTFIWLCFDKDDAGKAGIVRATDYFSATTPDLIVGQQLWEGDAKDIAEYLRDGGII